jgi:hypothetical protein
MQGSTSLPLHELNIVQLMTNTLRCRLLQATSAVGGNTNRDVPTTNITVTDTGIFHEPDILDGRHEYF